MGLEVDSETMKCLWLTLATFLIYLASCIPVISFILHMKHRMHHQPRKDNEEFVVDEIDPKSRRKLIQRDIEHQQEQLKHKEAELQEKTEKEDMVIRFRRLMEKLQGQGELNKGDVREV